MITSSAASKRPAVRYDVNRYPHRPSGTLIMATNRARCRDCETPEGERHALSCTNERCPFCGCQLASCGCIHQVLTLTEEERKSVEEYIDDSVESLCGVMNR